MGYTYECGNCGVTTTVVSQSTALDLLCHCTGSGEPMDYIGTTETQYFGHISEECDYRLR